MTSSPEPRGRTTLRLAPLRGVRYTRHAGDAADLMFTPPTSWSSVPGELLPRLDPRHILHLLAPAFGDNPEAGAQAARSALHSWLTDDVMRRDDEAALYVYEQPGTGASVRGVIGVVEHTSSQPAFLDHEEIIAPLVDVQRTLERTMHAHIEPILALHRNSPPLRAVLDAIAATPPDMSITDPSTGVHRLWRVTDESTCHAITDAIPDEPCLIADGHHRHAAWRHDALTLLTDIDQPGLRMGAIHRVIAGLAAANVLASPLVHTAPLPERSAALRYLERDLEAHCVLYSAGRFYAATPTQPDARCAAPSLAVCHLHSQWLPAWGATEANVSYVHEFEEAIALAGDEHLAILLPVPSREQVVASAHSGRPLPRKATSFRPKPLIGTVLNVWDS